MAAADAQARVSAIMQKHAKVLNFLEAHDKVDQTRMGELAGPPSPITKIAHEIRDDLMQLIRDVE